jgi:hypothetical protein
VTLVCPSCGRAHSDDERFCETCELPLVVEGGGEAVVTERQERARKVKASYTDGAYVRVAVGRQEAEAQLIQNLLAEEGIPSELRRSRGFENPLMLAAGPRDVMVPQSGESAAREVLLQAVPEAGQPVPAPLGPPWMWLVGGVVLGAVPFVIIALVA